ncbi:hypothetical protein G9A89_023579 [Geosiphon pyriformis]|nr:hypothetical protein G9A89_023579 [Geosiphon pyriformis]
MPPKRKVVDKTSEKGTSITTAASRSKKSVNNDKQQITNPSIEGDHHPEGNNDQEKDPPQLGSETPAIKRRKKGNKVDKISPASSDLSTGSPPQKEQVTKSTRHLTGVNIKRGSRGRPVRVSDKKEKDDVNNESPSTPSASAEVTHLENGPRDDESQQEVGNDRMTINDFSQSVEESNEPKNNQETQNSAEKPTNVASEEKNGIQEHKKNVKPATKESSNDYSQVSQYQNPKEKNSNDADIVAEDKDNKNQAASKLERARNYMPSNVLEKGHINFFYRPKIDAFHPDSPDGVQRLYIMLLPILVRPTLADPVIEAAACKKLEAEPMEKNNPNLGKTRLLIIGRKKLPEIGKHARYWAYVDKVFENLDDIKQVLGEGHYNTATRGERIVQPCRPLGRGAYSILEHEGHTHLAYVLELPSQPGEVQHAFNIKHEASYIITVKNPEIANPGYAGLPNKQRKSFPSHLMEKFQGRRFNPLTTTEYLDYENCEIILIGADEDITGELGETGENLEILAEEEAKMIEPLKAKALFQELHLEPKDFPSETLEGFWE